MRAMASLSNGRGRRRLADSDDSEVSSSSSSSSSSSEEEEDEEEQEAEATYTVPNTLSLKVGGEGVADVTFHPAQDLLGLITTGGRVRIYDVAGREEAVRVDSCGGRWHRGGRVVRFAPGDGSRLYSASAQGGVKCHDVATGGRVFCRLSAHSDAVSALLAADQHKLVTGSEAGEVKLFDTRMAEGCAFSLSLADAEEGEEGFEPGVNGLALDADLKQLLVAADDGRLRAVRLRGKRRLLCTSEPLGYSARSVAFVKDGRKAVVGSEEGVLTLFNAGEWGNLSDRFPVMGRPGRHDSRVIEAMAKLSEEVLCVGGEDGVIRAVRVLPNRVLGQVGRHVAGPEPLCDGLSLAVSPSGLFLASGCLEASSVQFWPVQHLVEAGREEAEELRRGKRKRKAEKEDLEPARKMVQSADQRRAFLSGLLS